MSGQETTAEAVERESAIRTPVRADSSDGIIVLACKIGIKDCGDVAEE